MNPAAMTHEQWMQWLPQVDRELNIADWNDPEARAMWAGMSEPEREGIRSQRIEERYADAAREAMAAGRWGEAIEHAKRAPGVGLWHELGRRGAPEPVLRQAFDYLKQTGSPSLPGLLSSVAENKHYLQSGHELSPQFLGDVYDTALDDKTPGSPGERRHALEMIRRHPNYDRGHLEHAAKFWRSYESAVSPSHFATLAHHVRGSSPHDVVEATDHRGKTGSSMGNENVLRTLEPYAQRVRDFVLNDKNRAPGAAGKPEVRTIRGKPHVKVYRGVAGDYADAIKRAANFENGDVDPVLLKIPVSSLSSWTADPAVADQFASRRIKDQTQHGIVMHKWMPVDHLMHSGFHKVVPLDHVHEDESELVFKHPKPYVKVPANQLAYRVPAPDAPDDVRKAVTRPVRARAQPTGAAPVPVDLGKAIDFWAPQHLEKMQTTPKLPGLGLPDNRRETPVVTTPHQVQSKLAGIKALGGAPALEGPLGTAASVGPGGPTVAYAQDADLVGRQWGAPAHPNTGMATKNHEDFHLMMQRVAHKYGDRGRKNLAANLYGSMHPEAQKALDLYMKWRQPPSRQHLHEERLANLFNYLNNPGERKAYADHLARTGGIGIAALPGSDPREHDQKLKEAFRVLQGAMADADEDWVKQDFYGLNKAEDDEVDRLLLHPDAVERRLALKLDGVAERHLERALRDPDDAVRRAALHHPALGAQGLLALMHDPEAFPQQLLALHHPALDRSHLEAWYHTHKDGPRQREVERALAAHDLTDGPLVATMFADGHPDAVVEHRGAPAEGLAQLVADHFAAPDDSHARGLARRALRHPRIPLEAATRALRAGDTDVKLAALHGPHLPDDVAKDVMAGGQFPHRDGEALLRLAVVQHPHASPDVVAQATRDRNQLVRDAAAARQTPFAKAELQAWLGDVLAKATKPKDFKGIVRATGAEGRQLVDHGPDLQAHPAGHEPHVAAYRQAVLDNPEPVGRAATGNRDEGISRKLIYKTAAGDKFMVKPYHERPIQRTRTWTKHPHQGWSEMTNQALYHAAGIGHLHQAVHVAEHDMGYPQDREPALVVKMAEGYQPIHELHNGFPKDEAFGHDVRKIALMDFLSNNLDRHGGNLMVKHNAVGTTRDPETGQVVHVTQVGAGGKPVFEREGAQPAASTPLAIDHSRSFQYLTTHQHKGVARRNQPRDVGDAFGDYVSKSAVASADPLVDRYGVRSDGTRPESHYEAQLDALNRYAPAFEWWGEVGPAVRQAFHKRLAQIKDPGVRDHLQRNFDARADWLDERAQYGLENYGTNWYEDKVPLYRPGEITDEEMRDRARQEAVQKSEILIKNDFSTCETCGKALPSTKGYWHHSASGHSEINPQEYEDIHDIPLSNIYHLHHSVNPVDPRRVQGLAEADYNSIPPVHGHRERPSGAGAYIKATRRPVDPNFPKVYVTDGTHRARAAVQAKRPTLKVAFNLFRAPSRFVGNEE